VTLHESWTLLEGNGIIVNKSGTKEGKIGSIGKPPIGYEAKIVDENGVMLPPGPNNIGEIITRRTNTSPVLEYLENSIIEKDQEYCIIKDGWSYSRDFGYKDKEGYVYYVGRNADKIQHEKEDFYAYEIENVARTHSSIFDCAVFGVPRESSKYDDIKICAVLKKDKDIKHEDLYNFMIQSLAYYKIPRYIEFKTELPRSSSTQIKKHILKKQWDSQKLMDKTWDSHTKDFMK
jgi:acyl-coenzyme A synthetase/AMP-(fatty) acid ligase